MKFSKSNFLDLNYFFGVSLSVSLLGLGISPVNAQQIFNLQGDYDFQDVLTLFPDKGYLKGESTGSSQNATLGLDKIEFLGYAILSEVFPALANGTSYTFKSNPQDYGINDENGYVVFFNQAGNKIFGTFSGSDKVNKDNSTAFTEAQLKIIGGEGKFKNASGVGTLFGTVNVNTVTFINTGKYTVDIDFSVPKSIPDSANVSGLVVVALAGLALKNKIGNQA
ncbi:hypothetical protein NIES4101_45450 [Calothrix sp. NIES-4101]|nr:hypothetical protein NIES4101_45450 [Calothrix sp. NIES-4101]